MNISELAVKRPVTTVMLILIVVVLGAVSFSRIGIDLFPNIEIPVAIVSTSYANVAPVEIETLITKPIEEALGTVENIDVIQSITMEGNSIVVAQFDFGTDMDFTSLKMREKVDMVKGFLPEGASDPMVMQIDPNAGAIMQISVSGTDVATLQAYAENDLKSRLERIKGVASVDISGGYENYVSIQVYTDRLNGYGLSMDTIAQNLAAQNLNLPAGKVNKGDKSLLVRMVGEFKSIEDVKNIPILLATGKVICLQDVAEIALENKELTSISKVNGESAVSLSVQKQSGTNTVAVADKVRETIEEINKTSKYKVDIVIDQSEYINQSIAQVSSNALFGGILAVLILFIFLRNIRSTLIIGLSIPISVIATFVLIFFNDITLNMMTLGGLALGIGMLVDNSVVVLENIYRYRQEGHSRRTAAIEGTKEVAMAVTASTLTTIAVFLPIAFVQGITSIMFRELALTVTFSLVASLIVSLTLIPMMASKMLKVDDMQGKHHVTKYKFLGVVLDKTDVFYAKTEAYYKNLLKWSLSHRKSVVLIAVVLFIASIASTSLIGSEFFPTADEGAFVITVELENGSVAKDTSAAIDDIIDKIKDVEEIDYVFSNTTSTDFLDSSQNQGQIQGVLKPLDSRNKSVFEVIDDLELKIGKIPGVKTTVSAQSSMMMMSGGSAIVVGIKGDDYSQLEMLAQDVTKLVKEVGGTKNVSSSISDAVPQIEINMKPAGSRYGLTTVQVANAVKGVIEGKTATRYKYNGEEIDVIIEGEDLYGESISNLEQVSIQTPMGTTVPLELVADIKIGTGPIALNRDNQARIVTVSADLNGKDLGAVTEAINIGIEKLSIPDGYTVEMTGQDEMMAEAFSDLLMALGLAILLVYMILASQFESLLMPFIIMFSTPLAFAGGLLGLFISGRTLNITSMIGFILLAGIVVNNAIVLVDYINTRRKAGEERDEAILNAGPIRLRPILMTTLTTVLGLVPMTLGIGEGAELSSSMGTVVIAGLSVSTLLTLIFIPVMYAILEDKIEKFKKKRKEKLKKVKGKTNEVIT
ncbi:MAG: multidrug ABC transporter [Firmicutes bacterium HGW-Firmicutes-1]|jgi:HAE1 family hydrophobic/amphiphilic exporter-1|nr:MAG: multidrug ABC transporter [Firmicutes bacterium HGW-Firmicutes-1]